MLWLLSTALAFRTQSLYPRVDAALAQEIVPGALKLGLTVLQLKFENTSCRQVKKLGLMGSNWPKSH